MTRENAPALMRRTRRRQQIEVSSMIFISDGERSICDIAYAGIRPIVAIYYVVMIDTCLTYLLDRNGVSASSNFSTLDFQRTRPKYGYNQVIIYCQQIFRINKKVSLFVAYTTMPCSNQPGVFRVNRKPHPTKMVGGLIRCCPPREYTHSITLSQSRSLLPDFHYPYP